MLSGKAIARAVRGHFIVDAAINALMLHSGFNAPLPCQPVSCSSDGEADVEAPTENQDVDEALALCEKLMAGEISAEEVCSFNILDRIKNSLKNYSKSVKKSSRTSALWVQYMDMIDILRKFIRAERTGNRELHLQAIQDMLPYMAASGHNSYTKSAMLYLQYMSNLETQHPDVQRNFNKGLHVIRRSNRLWAGLSSDLVIEQVLMRSLKTSGGLTQGRGMTERQRLLWLLSRSACAEVNQAMQELTGVNYNTGEQNKDMIAARQARDWKDTLSVLQIFRSKTHSAQTQFAKHCHWSTCSSHC
jgi:hypothetical protein